MQSHQRGAKKIRKLPVPVPVIAGGIAIAIVGMVVLAVGAIGGSGGPAATGRNPARGARGVDQPQAAAALPVHAVANQLPAGDNAAANAARSHLARFSNGGRFDARWVGTEDLGDNRSRVAFDDGAGGVRYDVLMRFDPLRKEWGFLDYRAY